jgi:hypothetical protein
VAVSGNAGTRTGTAADGSSGRTGDRTAVPGARTGTDDAHALSVIAALPRTPDGYVTVSQVRGALGCRRDRAVRLLKEAGLLSPADADKFLART